MGKILTFMLWTMGLLLAALLAAAAAKGLMHQPPQALSSAMAGISAAIIAVALLTVAVHALKSSHAFYELWIAAAACIFIATFGLKARVKPVLISGSALAAVAGLLAWDECRENRRYAKPAVPQAGKEDKTGI